MKRRALVPTLALLLPAALLAQDPTGRALPSQAADEPFLVPKTASGITVDAQLEEEAWEGALVIELNY